MARIRTRLIIMTSHILTTIISIDMIITIRIGQIMGIIKIIHILKDHVNMKPTTITRIQMDLTVTMSTAIRVLETSSIRTILMVLSLITMKMITKMNILRKIMITVIWNIPMTTITKIVTKTIQTQTSLIIMITMDRMD